jgi:hypothetical protein
MLNQTWFGTVIGILGIFIGIVFSIIIYIKSKRRIEIAFYRRGLSIINGTHLLLDDLEVFYRKEKVQLLMKSSIHIWNNGNCAIKQADIATRDKLKIRWENELIVYHVELHVPKDNKNAIRIVEKIKDKEIAIDFDYLNKDDGMEIVIFSNGIPSFFIVTGTVIGSKKPIKEIKDKRLGFSSKIIDYIQYSKIFSYIVLSVAVIFLGLAWLAPDSIFVPNEPVVITSIPTRIMLSIMSVFWGLLVPIKYIMTKRKYPEINSD